MAHAYQGEASDEPYAHHRKVGHIDAYKSVRRKFGSVLPSKGMHATSAESDSHLIPTLSTSQGEHENPALPLAGVTQRVAAIAIVVVVIDQVAKALMVGWIGPDQPYQRWELAGPWLAFEYLENTGAAFGILAGRVWLLSVLALLVGFGFLLAFRKDLPHSPALRLSIGLVIGGGLANFLDRVRLGYVIDFLAVGAWPKFNVADTAITIGLAVLAMTALRDDFSRENRT